jgi:fatty acid desaturase
MTSTPTERTADGAFPARSEAIASVEAPTLLLILVTYGAWLAFTWAWRGWPLMLVAPPLVVLLVLHSSLQHEIIHGHPTRHAWLNRLLGMVPLNLWLPFAVYRFEHLTHHLDARLTDPLDDPESYYWLPADWASLNPLHRTILRVQQTLAGRFLIGSFWRIGLFLRGQIRAVLRNEGASRAVWLEHLLWCVPVVLWVQVVCGMPMWIYVLAIVFPANGILLIRSFGEHRATPVMRERVAIVERSWILGPLFLFNNLHALHHEAPMIPWYRYNARYRRIRERLIADNGGLVYRTYFDVARRFLFRAHDVIEHPTGRVPGDSISTSRPKVSIDQAGIS